MKNIKKIIMALVLGTTLSNLATCGEIVFAREVIYDGWEDMYSQADVIYVGWEDMYAVKDKFWSSEEVGYSLNVVDAAGPNRFYSLSKTTNAGEEWTVVNDNPFNGALGRAEGISFINENLGFISLSHGAGSYGELYRTVDGGKSFEEVSFEDVQVKVNGYEGYNPFVIPGAPYEEDGCLYVLVSQCQMGDHNGGSKALFKSEDNGLTWNYVKEVRIELAG